MRPASRKSLREERCVSRGASLLVVRCDLFERIAALNAPDQAGEALQASLVRWQASAFKGELLRPASPQAPDSRI